MRTNKGIWSRGFTLVELMVVMAILGVLAAVVVPAVSGTKQVGKDSQVKTDATNLQSAMGKYNTDANEAELITAATQTNILDTASPNTTSNRWSERHLSVAYSAEFRAAKGTAANQVAELAFTGATKSDGTAVTSMADIAANYTAIEFAGLATAGYITEEPAGSEATFSSTKPYHNYLWLAKKIKTNQDTTDLSGRTVEVYKLTKIEASAIVGSTSADKLTYVRIF